MKYLILSISFLFSACGQNYRVYQKPIQYSAIILDCNLEILYNNPNSISSINLNESTTQNTSITSTGNDQFQVIVTSADFSCKLSTDSQQVSVSVTQGPKAGTSYKVPFTQIFN